MITRSSLTYRPDAFFFSPDKTLFIVEVKKEEITIDHLRVLVDFCSDLQPVYGSKIEVILSSPSELKPDVSQYIEIISSLQPFRFHFIRLTPEIAAYINSLDKGSPKLEKESRELLTGIV